MNSTWGGHSTKLFDSMVSIHEDGWNGWKRDPTATSWLTKGHLTIEKPMRNFMSLYGKICYFQPRNNRSTKLTAETLSKFSQMNSCKNWAIGNINVNWLKLTASLPLKINRPKRTSKFCNHWFSGVISLLVSGTFCVISLSLLPLSCQSPILGIQLRRSREVDAPEGTRMSRAPTQSYKNN